MGIIVPILLLTCKWDYMLDLNPYFLRILSIFSYSNFLILLQVHVIVQGRMGETIMLSLKEGKNARMHKYQMYPCHGYSYILFMYVLIVHPNNEQSSN